MNLLGNGDTWQLLFVVEYFACSLATFIWSFYVIEQLSTPRKVVVIVTALILPLFFWLFKTRLLNAGEHVTTEI